MSESTINMLVAEIKQLKADLSLERKALEYAVKGSLRQLGMKGAALLETLPEELAAYRKLAKEDLLSYSKAKEEFAGETK